MKNKLFLMLLCVCIFVVGCGTEKENGDVNVNIGFFPNITHAQGLYMKSMRLIETSLGDGYEVSWTSFNAGPAEVEAMFAGEVDLGYIGPVPAVSANVKSEGDISILAGATNGGSALVTHGTSNYTDISQLKGKKVAVPQLGNTQHLLLLQLLQQSGISSKGGSDGIEIVAVSNSDVQSLMEQGQIDAALVPEPWGTILEHKSDIKVLYDYKAIWRAGDYSVAVVVVRNEFMKEHPEVVEAFLKQHEEATKKINEDKTAAAKVICDEIANITNTSIDSSVYEKAINNVIVSKDIPKESIEAFATLSKEEEFILKLPDLNSLYQ